MSMWSIILIPNTKLASFGHSFISNFHAQNRKSWLIIHFLSSVFIDPSTDEIWATGDYFTWPALGDTLELIAVNGVDEFYRGQTGVNLISDMTAAGGNMTLEDLDQYT